MTTHADHRDDTREARQEAVVDRVEDDAVYDVVDAVARLKGQLRQGLQVQPTGP